MAFAQLPSYPPLDARSDGIAVRWTKWVSRLKNNLFVAYDITNEARKKALLLTYAGPDLNDIVKHYQTQNYKLQEMNLLPIN
ncbi:hypothetical protein PoB_005863000 [Plakobranchus ocellatus]|uniref:Uncharacterized protein n=1 Tax=Plakobranchus ocellatus TaxID=259542 RepID=A0AAV4CGZ1_9GAST|nr:hypothetical protein PoB_005863000 [Plakobranchus ocellatus]